MKFITICLFALFLLCGCKSQTPYVPRDTAAPETVSVGDYEYRESAISASSGSLFQATSRGFNYLDKDILTVYTPSLGKSYQVCYDPLCGHGMGSDCFYQFMVYGSVAAQKGKRLYWYDHDVNLEKTAYQELHYRICTTDMMGQDFEILYKNDGNYISEIILGKDKIYFTEQIDDRLCILHSIDYNGKNLKQMPYKIDETLVITSFACLGDSVYYVSNGLLCGDADLQNRRELAEVGITTLYANAQTQKLYYIHDEVVYCYDPAAEAMTEILSVEKGMHITNLCVTDAGMYYQSLPETITTASLYADYISCLNEGHNKLYCYAFATGQISETVFPEGLYIFTYIVANDLVFGIKCVENDYNQTVSGHGYFCWNMQTGEVADVS